jgi:hypothetical protein
MKLRMNVALIAIAIPVGLINNTHANPTNLRIVSEGTILGQQVIRELGENVKKANILYKAAVTDAERQEALKVAREAAQTLINTLNDIKTFGNDIVKGYNAAQRRQAAITMAELLMRENTLDIEIKSKRMEIRDMTNIGYIIDSPVPGKAEAREQAIRDLKSLHATLKDIRKAINDQEAILGKSWGNTIKLAIHNLIVGNSLGIAHGIDWYFGGAGAKLLAKDGTSQESTAFAHSSRRTPGNAKKQNAALRSWRHLRKSELLSKEIASAHELSQAKDLLNKLTAIKQDLKDVPIKHQSTLDAVSSSVDSLSRKIDRAKVSWLKVV